MPKHFAIVDKTNGDLCNKPGSGLYCVGNESDMEIQSYSTDCILVELTKEEYALMQCCGFKIKRKGEEIFTEKIEEIQERDVVQCENKHFLNIDCASKYVKDRLLDVTVNIHGVHYKDQIPNAIVEERYQDK